MFNRAENLHLGMEARACAFLTLIFIIFLLLDSPHPPNKRFSKREGTRDIPQVSQETFEKHIYPPMDLVDQKTDEKKINAQGVEQPHN